ncbi:MAG: energy transducer TonB [Xanthomonadales bacterium]|nr:energy transducer TonB [Xanthomonadales bacterium]
MGIPNRLRTRAFDRTRSDRRRRWLALLGTTVVHLLMVAALLTPPTPYRSPQTSIELPIETRIDGLLLLDVEPGGGSGATQARPSSSARPARSNSQRHRAAPVAPTHTVPAQTPLPVNHPDSATPVERLAPGMQAAGASDAGQDTSQPGSAAAVGEAASVQAGGGRAGANGERSGPGGTGLGWQLQAECRRVPYPEMARSRGWQGRTEIQVVLAADGQLIDASVLQSSGHALLDRSALQWARRCRYSAPPISAGDEAVASIPVNFRLRGASSGEVMVKAR